LAITRQSRPSRVIANHVPREKQNAITPQTATKAALGLRMADGRVGGLAGRGRRARQRLSRRGFVVRFPEPSRTVSAPCAGFQAFLGRCPCSCKWPPHPNQRGEATPIRGSRRSARNPTLALLINNECRFLAPGMPDTLRRGDSLLPATILEFRICTAMPPHFLNPWCEEGRK
jgi:hypothetical protein